MFLKTLLTFISLLLALSAIGFLLFPSHMLAVAGIASNPQTDFLLRTAGVGLAALLPSAWAARTAPASPLSRTVLAGLAGYMFLSSAVDFHAYTQSLVNWSSIPSIAFRIVLGAVIVWQMLKETKPDHPNS